MTTSAEGNLAGQDKEKEKVEKRRALGRGLASLLPGPRVLNPFGRREVAPPATGVEASAPQEAAPTTHSAPTLSPQAGHSGPPLSESQNPHAFDGLRPGSVAPDATRVGYPQESSFVASSAIATGELAGDPYGDAAGADVIEIQAVAETRVPTNLVVNLAITDIDKNPFQTRYVEEDDALEELADSIKANGVVQPIVVRPAEEAGRYILVLGERRLHASKKAEKTHIPALVRRVSDQQAAEMTIVENLQREDLSPLEQAQAFKVLSTQFSLTQEEIAQRVGLSRASIANYMRLLKLPREVMEMLAEKRINFAQAKELLKLGDNDRIAEAALYAVKKGMNIEQIEMLVLRMDGLLDPLPDMPGVKKPEKKSSGARWVDPNVRSAQMDLERMLGVRVRIRDRKGRGKIVIEYSTVDDYERVVEMLRGKK
jgi:ParB family transcriptional regulator, chromosome partitioning protein